MPALFRLDHSKSLRPRPVEILGGVSRSAEADLSDAATFYDTFLDHSAEGGSVCDFFAEKDIVDVGMGVHVDDAEGTVLFAKGLCNGEHDGVIPT